MKGEKRAGKKKELIPGRDERQNGADHQRNQKQRTKEGGR